MKIVATKKHIQVTGTYDEWRHFQIDPNPANDDKTMAEVIHDVASDAALAANIKKFPKGRE